MRNGVREADRGVSTTVGAILLLAILVIASGVFYSSLLDDGQRNKDINTNRALLDDVRGLDKQARLAVGTDTTYSQPLGETQDSSRFVPTVQPSYTAGFTDRYQVNVSNVETEANGNALYCDKPSCDGDDYESIRASPNDPSAVSNHTSYFHVRDGSSLVGQDFESWQVNYPSGSADIEDNGGFNTDDIERFGIDTDEDGEIDVNLKGSITGTTTESPSKGTIQVDGSYNLNAGDSILVTTTDITNPDSSGIYDVGISPNSGTEERDFALEIDNDNDDDPVFEQTTDETLQYESQLMSVEGDYYRLTDPQNYRYEYGVVFAEQDDNTLARNNPTIVDDTTINLLLIQDSTTRTASGTTLSSSIEPQSAERMRVTDKDNGITLTFRTRMDEDTVRRAFEDELTANGGHVTNVDFTRNADAPNTVEVTLERGIEYELRVDRVQIEAE